MSRSASSRSLVLILAAIVFGCCAVPTYAQLSSASVTGIVRDSSGSVIPNVKLVLRNVDTTVERNTTSNGAGNYVFLSITPGNYSIEASSAGFQTTQITSIILAVNQTATL